MSSSSRTDKSYFKKRRKYGIPFDYIDYQPKRRRCQIPRPLNEDEPGYSRRKALREHYYPVKKSKLKTTVSSDLLLDVLQCLNRNEALKCQLVSKQFHSAIAP
uniref:F-box domain-containing protein n=1 Tax=Acrobeloides nanus TaxID=290746 RepID=A0A914CNX6_9BILA